MDISQLLTRNFFHPKADEVFYPFLLDSKYPWELLGRIGSFILGLGPQLSSDLYRQGGEGVWIARSARIAEFVTIQGPAIIGDQVQVRPGAFIRGNVYVGRGSVVGNSTELKNVLLFGDVQVPHFNYVGDSILAYGAHMGAGSITSNIRADRKLISVRYGEQKIETGLRKFGAMIAEDVEIGCNAVLNPGILLGAGSIVYPLSCVRCSVPAGHIHKNEGSLIAYRTDY